MEWRQRGAPGKKEQKSMRDHSRSLLGSFPTEQHSDTIPGPWPGDLRYRNALQKAAADGSGVVTGLHPQVVRYNQGLLVLASQSPRRQQLLQNAGFEFIVRPGGVEEVRGEGETPTEYVRRLAREKSFSVDCGPGEIILAADTEVVLEDVVFGKPVDIAHAEEMLRLLSGREHSVISGICLRTTEFTEVDLAETLVRFRPLSPAEIREYVLTGEPMDKAGGYAIQGRASRFVERIEGCFFNVVGLPVELVDRRLRGLRHG